MIKSLITEYGLPWVINRTLYSAKLKMMRTIPKSERLFEKNVTVKRVNLFKVDTSLIESFLSDLVVEKQTAIITSADNAITGRIQGFSSIELDYGSPINWHLNPLTKKSVDRAVKWYEIPDFDPTRGDIKLVWEASRFTHFFSFARAFMITKDQKYYLAFSSQLTDWLQANVYPYGANYKCGQEATLRMINALIAYSVFNTYGLTTANDEANLQELIRCSYKKVVSNFFYAHKCIKNNHTLSEITGLIIGAWVSEDNKKLREAYKLLDEEIEKQFNLDGGYIQYSFNYQRFALQLMQFVIKISKETKIELSLKSKKVIEESAYLLYQMQDETGDIPNYGSNDGALIFPVTCCDYRDYRPVLNTIYGLIENTRIYDSGDFDEELLWFGNCDLSNIKISKIERRQVSFDESGFYSIRHKNGFLMTVLQNFRTRPAQMDQLHIDLWHKGVNVFCDSGTYSYATEIGKKLSLTAAHNTVMVENKEQMKKHGPFLIFDWTVRKQVEHSINSFSGSYYSKNGYIHKREIKRLDNRYTIEDEVIAVENAEYCESYFHTPCEVAIVTNGFELHYKDELICRVITSGIIEVNKANRSLYYLKNEEINCVVIKAIKINQKFSVKYDIELVN